MGCTKMARDTGAVRCSETGEDTVALRCAETGDHKGRPFHGTSDKGHVVTRGGSSMNDGVAGPEANPAHSESEAPGTALGRYGGINVWTSLSDGMELAAPARVTARAPAADPMRNAWAMGSPSITAAIRKPMKASPAAVSSTACTS